MPLVKSTRVAPQGEAPPSAQRLPSAALLVDRILLLLETIGPDVTVEERLHHSVLRRANTFAALKENPRGGVVVGLFLPGTLVGGRLLDGLGFRMNRITHQVVVREVAEVDEELVGWLKQAYRRG